MSKRVVITGMGAISPLGNSATELWDGLKNGKNGINYITKFDASTYKVKIAAEVRNFSSEKYVVPKDMKRYEDFSLYAICASHEALEDANIDLKDYDPVRCGVVIGSGIGGLGIMESQAVKMVEKGPSRITPLFIPLSIVNMAAGNVAHSIGANGLSMCVVTACATANHSIGEAFRQIKHGYLDMAVAGGTESCITGVGIAGFANIKALCEKEDINNASIPFDNERCGFVMGEGAGVLFLEELEHAKKRGAKIYAEIVGYGATSDAYHLTLPEPNGTFAAKAIDLALEEAGMKPKDVDYINAHGTSTPANDKSETLAIKKALGEHAYKVSISSTKSMTGHLLGAAAGVEAIACVRAVSDNIAPPTINLNNPDLDCDLDYTPNKAKEREIKLALNNSFGFGGHNSILAFKKYE